MTKKAGRKSVSLDGPRYQHCKVNMTQALYDLIEHFVTEERGPAFRSRNDLIEVALRYYIQQFERADGVVDRQGFPVIKAPDPHPPKKDVQYKKHA